MITQEMETRVIKVGQITSIITIYNTIISINRRYSRKRNG